jgi:serine/threonine-protein kinase
VERTVCATGILADMAEAPPAPDAPSPDVPPGRPDVSVRDDVPIGVPAPTRRRRTGVLVAAAVLAVLGVLVAAALTTSRPRAKASSPPAPAGQIRYSNHSPDFTVDHPISWDEASFPGALVVFTTSSSEPSDAFAENVNVLQQSVPEGTTLQEYTTQSLAQADDIIEDFQVVSSHTTTLSTLPAQELEYTGIVGGRNLQFFAAWTISGTSAYVLTYTAEPASYQRYLTEAVAIIRSFSLG